MITRTRIVIAIRKQFDIDSLLRLIREVVKQPGDQYLGIAFFLVLLLSHGSQKNRQTYQDRQRKQNSVRWFGELRYVWQDLNVPCNLPAQLFVTIKRHYI